MAFLTVSVEGLDGEKLFQKAKAQSDKIKEVGLDAAYTIALNRIRTNFQAEKDFEGNAWPESKAAQFRKAGGFTYSNGRAVTGGGTLFATGRLFRSIRLLRGGKTQRVIGTTVPYAPTHQFGLAGQEERPFIGVSDETLDLMTRAFFFAVKEVFETGGLILK